MAVIKNLSQALPFHTISILWFVNQLNVIP